MLQDKDLKNKIESFIDKLVEESSERILLWSDSDLRSDILLKERSFRSYIDGELTIFLQDIQKDKLIKDYSSGKASLFNLGPDSLTFDFIINVTDKEFFNIKKTLSMKWRKE